ncbi:MAG TPA: amino acid adenylation domain-containing protein, partial [Longimicrobiaceae bacterium]|nr:amino acid adenylation domain-containing protein [Longimicrobiaceae bacterium]
MTPGNGRLADDTYPLAPMQQGMLFHSEYGEQPGLYVQQFVCTLREPLRVSSFRRAWEELVERHAVLRTSFHLDGAEEPYQRVHPRVELPWQEHDWRELAPEVREERFLTLLRTDRLAPFDPAAPPLMRLSLLRCGEEEHRLLWTSHHVVMDGHARRLLLVELFERYEALLEGRAADPPNPRPYREHVEWLRRLDPSEARDFWRELLSGFTAPGEIAVRRTCSAPAGEGGGSHDFVVPEALTAALEELARGEGVSLNNVVQGAWALLLARYGGDSDVVFGNARACRRSGVEGAERMIGLFSNTVPLRVRVRDGETVGGHLRAVREQWTAMRPYEHTPLASIQGWSEVPKGVRLFESILGFERASVNEALRAVGPAWRRRSFELQQRTSYPLTVIVYGGRELSVRILYDAGRFEAGAVAGMGDHLTRILRAFAEDPSRPLGEIGLAGPEERLRLLDTLNRTATEFPGHLPVHRLFEAQAARTPHAAAVVFPDATLTYAELDAAANRLARRLRSLGVGPESRVGVCMERSAALVASLLAILKAGGAYVPLDTAYPRERLDFMVRDAGVSLVLASGDTRGRVPAGPSVLPVALEELPAAMEPTAPEPFCAAESLVYVMYTSGSTGTPKGIGISHRAVVRLVRETDYVRLGGDDRVAQASSTSFDAATFEIWGALLNGARLVGISGEVLLSPRDLARHLPESGVTALFMTTALFHQIARETPEVFRTLRYLLVGGETADPAAFRAVLGAGGPGALLHVYGPTESTTFASWHPVDRVEERAAGVPIGRPLANTRLYVLDSRLEPVPVGVPGELYIGGEGLARGYPGRGDLTAERFVPCPFAPEPGARMYRTGDRVRWLEEGAVEFLGRLDGQVKIRGFRIEPAEVEAALLEHPRVRQAVVLVLGAGSEERRLAGFVVGEEGEPALDSALDAHLRERLPAFMVPSSLTVLEELPLTPNGKVDRRALAAREKRAPRAPGSGGPLGATEARLAEIWQEVLGVEAVGPEDDFFAMGGHSIHLVRVVTRVQAAFGLQLSLQSLFSSSTLAGVAREVERASGGPRQAALPPVRPCGDDGHAPLSFAQQRLWFLHRLDPGSAAYNVGTALRIDGPLDAGALQAALDAVVERHQVLRTTFEEVSGEPRQRTHPARGVSLPLLDLSGAGGREREAERLAEEIARRPFRLEEGPLLRGALLRLGAGEHLLVLVVHHVVYDGWSAGVLARELRHLYGAFSRGEPPSLPPLPVQYADFARWQHRHLRPETLGEALAYWTEHLAGAEPLPLPTDGGAAPGGGGRRLRFSLPAELGAAVRERARASGVTPFMVLLAAFSLLLRRLTGHDAPVVATPVAGREREELEGLIGFFVNTLALRTTVEGEEGFAELLERVRGITLAGFERRHVPFEQVVAALRAGRDEEGSLAQVMFALHTEAGEPFELPGLGVRRGSVERGAAKFALLLSMEESPEGFSGAWEYDAALFEPATVRRMAAHFERLLEGALASPRTPVDDLPLLAPEEERRIVHGFNRTEAEVPAGEALHRLFEAQAARTPGAVAVAFREEALTFAELDRRSNQLARVLRARGVGPESRVGVCMERGTEMILALLAVWKAGGAYVPLDPAHPPERISYVLEECAAPVVLTRGRAAGALTASRAEALSLDGGRAELAAESAERLEGGAGPESLAYVIYTSGSTGRPKGVMVEHRSVVNLAAALRRAVYDRRGVERPPRVGMNGAFTFDTTVKQIVQLLSGSTLEILPEEVRYDGPAFARYLREHEVEVLDCTPAQLRLLLADGLLDGPEAAPTDVLVAGEAIDEATWRRLAGDAGRRFYNLYGPTECTVDASLCEVGVAGAVPVIGRPLANVRLYVLDGRMQPVPVGVPGELHVGGAGVARGYLGRPELTAERFVPDPFGPGGGRLYRTGDRVRWREDGTVEFLGRTDHQVKVRGFRIEPGEIEAALRALPGVRETVVLAREDEPGEKRLVAYVVPEAGAAPAAADLVARLGERLPRYMVPSAIVLLDALPLTGHGKVDRRALPAPARGAPSGGVPAAPRTAAEEILAKVWAEVLGVERVG